MVGCKAPGPVPWRTLGRWPKPRIPLMLWASGHIVRGMDVPDPWQRCLQPFSPLSLVTYSVSVLP